MICAPLTQPANCNNRPGQGACQQWGSKTQSTMAALGAYESIQISFLTSGGINVSYPTGGSGKRSSVINLICDESVTTLDPTKLQWNIAQTPGLVYTFTLLHAVGCPTSSGQTTGGASTTSSSTTGGGSNSSHHKMLIGVGWIMDICFLCLAVVYFVGGMLFLKFVKKEEGANIIPNVNFWKALPGLFKDGIVFSFKKMMFCKKNSYSTVAE